MSGRWTAFGAVALFLVAVITLISSHVVNSQPDGIYNYREACYAEGGTIVPSGVCVQKIHLEGFDR